MLFVRKSDRFAFGPKTIFIVFYKIVPGNVVGPQDIRYVLVLPRLFYGKPDPQENTKLKHCCLYMCTSKDSINPWQMKFFLKSLQKVLVLLWIRLLKFKITTLLASKCIILYTTVKLQSTDWEFVHTRREATITSSQLHSLWQRKHYPFITFRSNILIHFKDDLNSMINFNAERWTFYCSWYKRFRATLSKT